MTGRWLASGAAALTGRAEGPALAPPPGADLVLEDRQRRIGDAAAVDVAALVGERAALGGLQRRGTVSCGGASRLLATDDGWCVVSLPRATDRELLPAWLGVDDGDEVWERIGAEAPRWRTEDLVRRGQLLGVPCAGLGLGPSRSTVIEHDLGPRSPRSLAGALVVDLSALWAGPLCAHLLRRAGAHVVKVESTGRPDGARLGSPEHFALLHAGQQAAAFDFATAEGRAGLRALLLAADVVVEGSRPRALTQLGFDPHEVTAAGNLCCWVSITGYGREPPWDAWVGLGDDAAAGAGLVAWEAGEPRFCADAVADPLAGLAAAARVREVMASDRALLLDVSLHAAAAEVFGGPAPRCGWSAVDDAPPPTGRAVSDEAPALGQDTDAVVAELAAVR